MIIFIGKGSKMVLKLISKVKDWLFKNDSNYKVDYVLANISRLTVEDLLNINLYRLYKHKSYDYVYLKDLHDRICDLYNHLDSDTYDIIPTRYVVMVNKDRPIPLIDLLDSGDGIILNNYRELIRDYINVCRGCVNLQKEMTVESDIDLQFNSSIIRTYIIIMEDIVNSLYTILHR